MSGFFVGPPDLMAETSKADLLQTELSSKTFIVKRGGGGTFAVYVFECVAIRFILFVDYFSVIS